MQIRRYLDGFERRVVADDFHLFWSYKNHEMLTREFYKCIVLLQVNETLIRSIVTQPSEQNYVYADDYGRLDLVRNLVLNKACRVLVTPATTWTTRIRPSPSLPTTTTTPILPSTTDINRRTLRTIPSFDGNVRLKLLSVVQLSYPHFITENT